MIILRALEFDLLYFLIGIMDCVLICRKVKLIRLGILKKCLNVRRLYFKPRSPLTTVLFVIMDYKYKRAKIRSGNFCFKQIRDLSGHEIAYLKVHKLYDPNDSLDVRNVTVVKSDIERIDYKNILKAIGNTDFTQRQPRLDKNGVFTSKEVFFLNIDRKLIFHMYDDRGLDIIASDVEQLRPIYNKYNSWLLNSNREKIDGLFNKEKL